MNQKEICATDLEKAIQATARQCRVNLKSFSFALNALVPAHYSLMAEEQKDGDGDVDYTGTSYSQRF